MKHGLKHIIETDLALYAAGDLSFWRRAAIRLHVRGCDECVERLSLYREDRQTLRFSGDEIPAGVDWKRLSAEMTGNIRVGLAAGECVAPNSRKAGGKSARFRESLGSAFSGWRAVAYAAGLTVVFGVAWWMNMPAADTEALGRVARGIVHGGRIATEGPVAEASSNGVEVRANGGSLGITASSSRAMTLPVSLQGSASTRYVDDDTGVVTTTTVYVQ